MNIFKTEKYRIAREKAEKKLSELTLMDKIGQISQYGHSIYSELGQYYETYLKDGKIGSYLAVTGAELTNSLQKRAIAETPHNLPMLFAADVIHGFKTTMPTPLAMSCSWEPEVVEQAMAVSAKEAYAAGVKWTFAPMVDIARDPRWGRIVEGFGEDSFLGAKMSAAAVRGFQGDELGSEDHIGACAKHFAAYGACEGGRDYNSVDMSLQKLWDVYLPPFIAAFNEGATGVMTAFNDINGVPCSANEYLLKDVLRKQCDFKGLVISDFNSVQDMVAHGYSETQEKAFVDAFAAGVDILMAGEGFWEQLPKALEEGIITEEQINESALRVLTMKYLVGIFENPFVDEAKEACFYCDEHRAVSREAGKRSVVLLENDGALPLKQGNKIAVVGPLADDDWNILGPWCGLPEKGMAVSVLKGLQKAMPDTEFIYEKGCDIEGDDTSGFENAVKAANSADVVIVVVGESIDMAGEAKNRSDLHLPGVQEQFVETLIATDKPVVVLVSAGRPLVLTNYNKKASALVYMWQLGAETGNAVADVLTGKYNPSGRLTTSFPYSVGQLPVYYNYFSTGKPALDKVWYEAKYLDVPIAPLYPFGYGKSYSEFEVSDASVSSNTMKKDGYIDVSCTVSNTGDYDGETVVELYVRDLFASRVRPVRELKGFKKVFVEKKSSQRLTLRLNAESLSFKDWNMNDVIEEGDYKLWIGFDCLDCSNEFDFKVEKG
ncbi:MAG: glycoside hydrolase family 3 C-terminal domain-containing protein [Clostridia bacterium]|nr:glycoside hydrolase family 3 C-terminal domain-containing protein [Clostridia bacterium]